MSKRNQCTKARHCNSLAEQGVWAQIERLTNAAHFRKANKDKPIEEWEFPTLLAARETLSNACNCSLSTIDRHLARLVRAQMLEPQGEQFRLKDGRWSCNTYKVMLHDSYADTHPCPPFNEDKPKGGNAFPQKRIYTEADMRNVYDDRKDGFTFKEIAERSGIPKTQVHRMYKKAVMIQRSEEQKLVEFGDGAD